MVDSAINSGRQESDGSFSMSTSRARWIVVFALVAVVSLVFLPARRFEFIKFDVPDQILNNPHVRGLSAENVWHILTSRCVTSYYPIRTLSFALDHEIWGLEATGFKLTNILIHLVNVLLVYWLLLRILARDRDESSTESTSVWSTFSAAFASGIFAVHPLVVEPVVWVPGREELLMTICALAAVHCHLFARALAEQGRSRVLAVVWHMASAVCCLFACLSNAVGAVIPLLVTTWDLLRDRRFSRIVAGTSLLWCVGVATIVVKRIGYVQHPAFAEAAALDAVMGSLGHGQGQSVASAELFSCQHLGLALRAFWLNVSSVFSPTDLTVSYDPILPPSIWHVEVWLGALAIIAFLILTWLARRRKRLLLGMLWFGVALLPVSQIMPHHVHRADRFLYLPLIGVSIAIAALLARAGESTRRSGLRKGIIAVCAIGGLVTVVAAVDQVAVWQTNLSLWRHAVEVASRNRIAHRLLADELAEAGQFEEAFRQYRLGLEIDVFDAETLDHYARYLAVVPRPHRDCELASRLAMLACQLTSWSDPGVVRTLAIAHNNLADRLRQEGDFAGALSHYACASDRDPDYLLPILNRALLLAICQDENLRSRAEAVRLADLARTNSSRFTVEQLVALAEIYQRCGRQALAAEFGQQAIAEAKTAGRDDLVMRLERDFGGLRSRQNGQDSPSAEPEDL